MHGVNVTEPTDEIKTYSKRKEAAVLKDLETAFSGYQRLVVQVNSIRTWTVTVISASLVLILTNQSVKPLLIDAIALIAMLAFLILELRERSSMAFNKTEVLKIERILMETDQIKYEKLITEYVFRDLRLVEISRYSKLLHLFGSIRSWNVIIWYGCWLLLLTFALLLRIWGTNEPPSTLALLTGTA